MKRIFKFLTCSFVCLCGVLTIASCKENHKHNANEDEWVRDSSSHWHACDGCDEQVDLSVHNYGIPVKTEKTMKDYLAEAEAFVITGQMRNLMKTVDAATGLKIKTKVIPSVDFDQDYKLITIYDRLVLQGIR